MLNPTEFAILTIEDARKIQKALVLLVDKREEKFKVKTQQFFKKLKDLDIYDFYLSLEDMIYQNSKWQQIQNLDADEVATRDFVRDEIYRQ
jgi:hypothetical protein